MTPDLLRDRIRSAFLVVVLAAPVFAHGWAPPPGGGTPTYQGPAGGGAPTSGLTGGVTDPTGVGQPTAGSTPTSDRPAPTGAAPRGPERQPGRATAASKSKAMMEPWDDLVSVPWTAAFLPMVLRDGYAAAPGTIQDAIRLPVKDGGWARDDRPTVVVVFDSRNDDQKRAVTALSADARFKAAAHFFNCFRVDLAGTKQGDARLLVFGKDGTQLLEIVGQRRLTGALAALEATYTKEMAVDLTERLPKMEYLLKTKAFIEFRKRQIEGAVVCPDCGQERTDIVEELGKLKVRDEVCDTSIAMLRQPAK